MTDDDRGSDSVPPAEVYASDIEGQQYRGTAYVPVPDRSLQEAPRDQSYPATGRGGRYRLLDLPKVPKLSHVVGPSAIMLGASVGSGETLFWPLLVAQSGWSLYWVFWVGVLTQFFINTEIQRWTLATGESIFRAFDRVNQPGWPRVVATWWATAFFGFFSVLLVGTTLWLASFRVSPTVAGSGAGGYALWAGYFLVQAVTMYVSTREKLRASGTVPGLRRVRGFLQ